MIGIRAALTAEFGAGTDLSDIAYVDIYDTILYALNGHDDFEAHDEAERLTAAWEAVTL